MNSLSRTTLLGTVLFLAISQASLAQGRVLTAEQALRQDAQSYARSQNVSLKEATWRLKLQPVIGQLNAALANAERGTFAGLWIEHSPYRIVARFTEPAAMERVAGYLQGTGLERFVDLEQAPLSLAQLQSSQASVHRLARELDTQVESEINLQANWVQVYTLDPAALSARMNQFDRGLPAGVMVFPVERLSSPEVNIYGGLAISTCTTGFSVQNGSGTRGVSTAAHCSNTQSYSGTSLPYQSGDITGNQDVQWHTAPGFTVTNQFNDGSSARSCTGTLSRSSQNVGDYVCKYGKTSGYTCGAISSTTYAPSYVTSASATFIRVDNNQGYADLSSPGDSGGPWFLANTAYGTHSGEPGADAGDSIYMAINYIPSLSVSVLTAP